MFLISQPWHIRWTLSFLWKHALRQIRDFLSVLMHFVLFTTVLWLIYFLCLNQLACMFSRRCTVNLYLTMILLMSVAKYFVHCIPCYYLSAITTCMPCCFICTLYYHWLSSVWHNPFVTLSFAAQTSDGRSDGKSKKVSDEYAAKLNSMQTELKKLQAAKREHTKLLRNQTHYETQLRTLRNDLASLKQLKVCNVICSCSLIGCLSV